MSFVLALGAAFSVLGLTVGIASVGLDSIEDLDSPQRDSPLREVPGTKDLQSFRAFKTIASSVVLFTAAGLGLGLSVYTYFFVRSREINLIR